MVLLNTYIEALHKDYEAFKRVNLKKFSLDFSKEVTHSLGNFYRVLHQGTTDKTLTFEYLVHSHLLGEDVRVSFIFEADENDSLNAGFLSKFTISNNERDVIYTSSKETPCLANYSLLRDNFLRFIYGQYIVDRYQQYAVKCYQLDQDKYITKHMGMPSESSKEYIETHEKELASLKNSVEQLIKKYNTLYGENSMKDIVTWVNEHGIDYYLENTTLANGEKTYIDKFASGNIELANTALLHDTLFFFPLLEKLDVLDKKSFKNTLLEYVKNLSLNNVLLLAVDKIDEAFAESNYNTFGEYYRSKEKEQLQLSIAKLPSRWLPYFYGIKYWEMGNDNELNVIRKGDTFRSGGFNITKLNAQNNAISVIDMNRIEVDFCMIYDVMMTLDIMLDDSCNIYYKKGTSQNGITPTYNPILFEMFKLYISEAMTETITSEIPHALSYIPTSVFQIKRLYPIEGEETFTILLKRYFEARRKYYNQEEFLHEYDFHPGDFINRWIKKFEIGNSITIENSLDGVGVIIRLHKDELDTQGSLLAEQGYGITHLCVLLLRIETAIMETNEIHVNKNNHDLDRPSFLRDDEELSVRFSESNIAIEEPEVHLHPRFQSLLADLFVEAYTNYNVHFIVETHSEYLIRKLQVMVADKESNLSSNDVALYYVDKNVNGAAAPRKIEIREDGGLNNSFGTGFYDEADILAMDLFRKKAILS